jgi:type IV pilus assembly protein PilY1
MELLRQYTYSYSPNDNIAASWPGRYLFIALIAGVLLSLSTTNLYGAAACAVPTPDSDVANYAAIPPFITGGDVKPNILILLDNSGSMNEFAYKRDGTGNSSSTPDDSYNPGMSYFGYFDPDKMYLYDTSASGHFREDTSKSLDKTSFWSGNFLNWVTMRRVDLVRKVLVGGKAVNRAINLPKYVVGHESPDRDFWKYYSGQLYRVDDDLYVCNDSTLGLSCANSDSEAYNVKVYTGAADEPAPAGIVQAVEDRARFGLMFFNKGNRYSQEADNESNKQDGGYLDTNVKEFSATDLLTGIENTDPSTWSPLGEALYEAVRVFMGQDSAYTNANYDADPTDPLSGGISCQKNFVLVVTDGASTKDKNLPGTYWTGSGNVSDPNGFDAEEYLGKIYNHEIATDPSFPDQRGQEINGSDGTWYLDAVSYYAHITDLRTPTLGRFDIEGRQNLNIYTVYAFDQDPDAEKLLNLAAKYGGFEDRDGNGKPDGTEWDAVDTYGYNYPDGNADTYYAAPNANNLGPTLLKALFDIFKRAASGSSTSVITTTGEGEGAVYQAFFYPKKTFDGAEEIEWVGFLNSLFVDPYGNIREDTAPKNAKLDMASDRILKMRYDPTIGTLIDLYVDTNGNGKPDDFNSNTEFSPGPKGLKLEEISPVWEAGTLLHQRSTARLIKTEDPDPSTAPDASPSDNMLSFVSGNVSAFQDILRAADSTEATNIINWVNGTDVAGYRSRTVTYNSFNGTWKLGDIINSSPTTIGRPGENYGLIYGDYTYGAFKQKYLARRISVYVGGNDGMLHAFNGGFFDTTTKKFYKKYDPSGTPKYSDLSGPDLGEELWAYIPKSLLPHMKWLTRSDYPHMYYVDMTPKVTDARIFAADSSAYTSSTGTHPYGWGTVLVNGLRLGGKSICTSGNVEHTAEYFALDITVPESPKLLWSWTPPDRGVTFSRPAIIRVKAVDPSAPDPDDDHWFMIVGSGPQDYDGFTNIDTGSLVSGKIYVVNLKNGSLVRTFTTTDGIVAKGGFFADPISIDVLLDNKIDVAYIGESYYTGGSYSGKMYRINTQNDPNPLNWTLGVLHATSKPITAAPTAALDQHFNLWLFFGTGKFLGTLDKNTTDSGEFFGIKDGDRPWVSPYNNSGSPSLSLLDVTEASVDFGGGANSVSVGGDSSITNWSELISGINSRDGWFIDHGAMTTTTDFLGNALTHDGERVFVKPAVLGGLVVWSTYIPGTDLCSFEGVSNVYAVYYETGTSYFGKYLFSEELALEKSLTGQDVSRSMKLGAGMPARVGTMITKEGELKGFSQQSTGTILEIDAITPLSVTSGVAGWKEDQL